METAMAEDLKDPLTLWRDMLSEWEKSYNAVATKAMASEDFSRTANRASQAAMQMQQAMTESMGRYLALMNLPGRADSAAIEERIRGIEDGIGRIAAALERGRAGALAPDAAPRPPRTKRPPRRSGAS
jgi:hypothetical protein